ncbi:MAG: penicillin-insensitive murein endopeptidase [Gammaproteobacteria bacterium]|nr:penicillin-insensitive murein endopeptidase [Gammaproteobacteria bacterium]
MRMPIANRAVLTIGLGLSAAWLTWSGVVLAQDWITVTDPVGGPGESVGRYAAGCLVGGERLAPDGTGYQAVRVARNRHYGHPELVRFIEDLARQTNAAELGLLPVGDMSQPRGGPMIQAHASHQVGLDVDIFFRLDLPTLTVAERGEDLELPSYVEGVPQRIDARFGGRHFELLRLAASDSRVARIFVHPAIKQALCEQNWQDRSFLRTVRPWYGHEDHMHVRLHCPSGSADCVGQAPPAAGDGCGAEVASWLDRGPLPRRPPGVRREPELPPRCEALR